MKKLLIFTLFIISNTLWSQTDSVDTEILKMMEVLGVEETMKSFMDNHIQLQEELNPELLRSEYWRQFKDELIDYNEFLKRFIPVYKKHFSPEEIMAITDFYSTPIGQSLIKKLPVVTAESMQIGKEWGEEIGRNIDKKMQLLSIERFDNPKENCGHLKNGRFKYYVNGTEVLVERKGNIQEEKVNGQTYKFKVEWLSNCQYQIWEFQNDDNYSQIKPVLVTIYDFDSDQYKYAFKAEGTEEYFEGVMKIME